MIPVLTLLPSYWKVMKAVIQFGWGQILCPFFLVLLFVIIWVLRHLLNFFIPCWAFPGGSVGKESACSAGDLGSIPASERSREENGSPYQYSCLENSPDSLQR